MLGDGSSAASGAQHGKSVQTIKHANQHHTHHDSANARTGSGRKLLGDDDDSTATAAPIRLVKSVSSFANGSSYSSTSSPPPAYPAPKSDKKAAAKDTPTVGLAIKILQVFNVHSITQTYEADFILIASWFDGTLSSKDDLKRVDWKSKHFRPDIQVNNQKEIQVLDPIKAFQPRWASKAKDGHLRMTVRMQGTLHSAFDLKLFPFDTQHLKIQIRIRMWAKQDVRLIQSSTDQSVIVPGRELVNDFVIFPNIKECVGRTSRKESVSGDRHWKYVVTIPCQRIYHSYLFHVFPVLFILASFCWVVFLLPPIILVDRLSVVITIILTLVAYKFVIDDRIPNVHYLTFLDKYILTIFFLLFFCAVENCVFYQKYAWKCPPPPALANSASFPEVWHLWANKTRPVAGGTSALFNCTAGPSCVCPECCNVFGAKHCDECVSDLCSAIYANAAKTLNASVAAVGRRVLGEQVPELSGMRVLSSIQRAASNSSTQRENRRSLKTAGGTVNSNTKIPLLGSLNFALCEEEQPIVWSMAMMWFLVHVYFIGSIMHAIFRIEWFSPHSLRSILQRKHEDHDGAHETGKDKNE